MSDSLNVEQYLNQSTGETLRDRVRELLSTRPETITLDFSGTRLVNSIGVSFLLEIIDLAERNSASLQFIHVPADICDLFQLLGIARRVPVS